MDLDDLLQRYFGSADLASVPPGALAAGIEKIQVDFGLERDRAKRFGLWCLLYLLDAAPELDVAFPEADDKEAARNFMDLLATTGPEQD